MVQDHEGRGLDGVRVEFDDERVVSGAGVILVATLAARPGIEVLAGRLVGWRRDRPGGADAARDVMALLFAMVLGADSIDDCHVLRAGRTRWLLGGWLPAPSTLGTFLRGSRSGTCASSTRCWAAHLRFRRGGAARAIGVRQCCSCLEAAAKLNSRRVHRRERWRLLEF
jgi:hypothetical protein